MPLEGLQFGRYHLKRRIGKGGMGEVYQSEDTHIGREVAIKVIEIEDDSDSSKEDMLLFEREMEAIGSLNHPRTLPLYDYGETTLDGGHVKYFYMVMPLCREDTLAAWRQKRQGPKIFSLTEVVHFVWQAATALQDAHDHQVIHRDVKPQNFLIRFNKETPRLPDLLLADFGIAKIMTATHKSSGKFRGTPPYMAPEQWSINPIDKSHQPKIDQYSLAIMTYELLTGQLPFQGDLPRLIHMHANVQPQPPSSINPNIPAAVDIVILRALAKKPEARYASVIEFAEALQRAARSNEKGEDIHVVLVISEMEAIVGTECSLALPQQQALKVVIPAGIKDGHIIHQEGHGKAAQYGGPAGTLHITVSTSPNISSEEIIGRQLHDLKQDLNSLKANSLTDEKVNKQLHDLKKGLDSLKTDNLTQTKTVVSQLQSFSDNLKKDLNSLKIDSRTYTQTVVSQMQSLSDNLLLRQADRNLLWTGKRSIRTTIIIIAATIILVTSSFNILFNVLISNSVANTTLQNIAATTTQMQSDETETAFVATATATIITGNPYPTYFPGTGKLVLFDPLNRNYPSHWDTNSSCSFIHGAYHATTTTKGLNPCLDSYDDFSDFAFQVQITILNGNCGGIAFRVNSSKNTFSYFEICQNGYYKLNGPQLYGSSSAIKRGFNQVNLIAIVAKGNNVAVYVNGQQTDTMTNNSTDNEFGLLADNQPAQTEVAFNNVQIWSLTS